MSSPAQPIAVTISSPTPQKAAFLNQLNAQQPLSLKARLGWKPVQYLALAAIAGGVGLLLGGLAALALKCVAVWFVWCAAIVVLNQLAYFSESLAAKAIHWIHANSMEINAVCTAARLFPLTFSSQYLEPKGPVNGPPVLLVHAYLSFASTFDAMREQLVQAGYRVYVMNTGSLQSIETYAEQVDVVVKKIQTNTGRNDIGLVGHSRGGLVVSHWALHHAKKYGAQVRVAITIASPLGGTPLAKMAPGLDAQQMTPHHPFHEELRKTISSSDIPFLHIGSASDFVVGLKSALPENAPCCRVLKDVGHLEIVFDPRTGELVRAGLKAADKALLPLSPV